MEFLTTACQMVGENGMGALVYRPAKESSINEEVHPLSFYALEVEKILHDNYSGSFEELFHRAGSSGGSRPKVLVKIDGNEWLVKFKASSDPVNVGSTEHEYSLLAKKCGIEMAETRLFEGKYFGVRRFDRQPFYNSKWKRTTISYRL